MSGIWRQITLLDVTVKKERAALLFRGGCRSNTVELLQVAFRAPRSASDWRLQLSKAPRTSWVRFQLRSFYLEFPCSPQCPSAFFSPLPRSKNMPTRITGDSEPLECVCECCVSRDGQVTPPTVSAAATDFTSPRTTATTTTTTAKIQKWPL